MRTINLLATFAFMLVVMFMGCKNDDFNEVVGVCPEVILTVPANGAVGVPLNQIITANFNASMNPLTINGSTFLVHSGTTQIAGTVTYSGITATFTPSSPLAADTEYTGTITTESKDLLGSRLMEDYTWSFTTLSRHTVTLSSNPTLGGTTSGGATYDKGASVIVSATANEGYTFTNWTEGTNIVSTDSSYTFVISGNRVLAANFTQNAAPQFNVSLSGNPTNGGTTSGAGSFDSGASVNISAIANQGYIFTNWTEGANVVSTTANFTFIIASNRVLVANFTETTNKFNVSLSSNPALGGTTSGGGEFDSGASVTVSAIANQGFTFTNWTEGTNIVSTNANYTFNIASNRNLVANFSVVSASQFDVSLTSNPALGGTTSGGGAFDSGISVTVSAIANQGYSFTNWTEGSDIVSTNANYSFNITRNRVLVANFTETINKFNVGLSSNPTNGGTTSGGGDFDSGESVTVSATANNGFSFTNWTEGSEIVSTNANYTFNITENRVLVANFTPTNPAGPAAINFGTAGDFSILTKSGISSTGITSVQGDIGVSPAAASAITGFGLIMDTNGESSHTTIATHVTGKVYASDYAPPTPSNLTVAISDMEIAYTTANNLVTPAPVLEEGAGNISGLTLAPGLYKWSTGVKIDPDASVTLSGGANDTWVFQIAQDLTLMSKAQVKLIGGAQAKNITWVVAGQAVLGAESVLFGTIMSKTLISLNTGSKVTGRLLAQTAVTLNASTVVKP